MTYPATRADLMRKVGGSICTYQIRAVLDGIEPTYGGLTIRCSPVKLQNNFEQMGWDLNPRMVLHATSADFKSAAINQTLPPI